MLEAIQTWIGIAASLGVIAGIGFLARHWWNRRRWRAFSSMVGEWAENEPTAVVAEKSQLQPLVCNWLVDAGFGPQESLKLFEFAVMFAQARVDLINKEWNEK